MPTYDEDRVLEILDDLECRRLLTTARLGRLGFTDRALPAIVPVPFTVGEDSVVIPANRGNWVVSAIRGAVVAFAVDAYDVDARIGWGVTVVGPSRVLLPAGSVAMADGHVGGVLPPAAGDCFIIVQMGLLRGWRLSLPAAAAPEPTEAGVR